MTGKGRGKLGGHLYVYPPLATTPSSPPTAAAERPFRGRKMLAKGRGRLRGHLYRTTCPPRQKRHLWCRPDHQVRATTPRRGARSTLQSSSPRVSVPILNRKPSQARPHDDRRFLPSARTVPHTASGCVGESICNLARFPQGAFKLVGTRPATSHICYPDRCRAYNHSERRRPTVVTAILFDTSFPQFTHLLCQHSIM